MTKWFLLYLFLLILFIVWVLPYIPYIKNRNRGNSDRTRESVEAEMRKALEIPIPSAISDGDAKRNPNLSAKPIAGLFKVKPSAPDANSAIDAYLTAIEQGHEEGIMKIADIYMHGLHPYYLPDKLTAARICNMVIQNKHFSLYLRRLAKSTLSDIIVTNDPDAVQQADRVYKHLPTDIMSRIETVVSKRLQLVVNQPFIPMKTVDFGPVQVHAQVQAPDHSTPGQNTFEFDLSTIDIAEQARILQSFQVRHRAVDNDSQNVHDTVLQNVAKKRLDQIIANNDNDNEQELNDFQVARHEFMQELAKESDYQRNTAKKENVKRVLDSLSTNVHSRYNQSEQQVFQNVWQRIKEKQNSADITRILGQQMEDAVEHGLVVCSTGKIVRMLGAFEGVDKELTEEGAFKPTWVLNREIANKAVQIREAYVKDDPLYEPGQGDTSEQMKRVLIEQTTKEYVDSGIMKKEDLETALVPYLESL